MRLVEKRYRIPMRGKNQRECLAARAAGVKWVYTPIPNGPRRPGLPRGGRPPKDPQGLTERELLERWGPVLKSVIQPVSHGHHADPALALWQRLRR